MGTCPKCGEHVLSARLEPITIDGGVGKTSWKGVSYLCPSCSCVLSVGIDPVALRSETVSQISASLGPISQALSSILVQIQELRKG